MLKLELSNETFWVIFEHWQILIIWYFAEPIPKPRLNVSLSNESADLSSRKKKPVPQPRSLASKSASRILMMTSDIQPVASANLKIYSKVPSRHAGRLSEPPMPSSPPKTSSSSSSEDEYLELPPALPPKGCSSSSANTNWDSFFYRFINFELIIHILIIHFVVVLATLVHHLAVDSGIISGWPDQESRWMLWMSIMTSFVLSQWPVAKY